MTKENLTSTIFMFMAFVVLMKIPYLSVIIEVALISVVSITCLVILILWSGIVLSERDILEVYYDRVCLFTTIIIATMAGSTRIVVSISIMMILVIIKEVNLELTERRSKNETSTSKKATKKETQSRSNTNS